jgi:hypothetical protein
MKNKQGSIIIFIIILLSALGICVAGVWHSMVFALRISHKRQLYEQRYRATEGLLIYGIALCKQNWEQINNTSASLESKVCIPSWPSGDGQSYDGLLTIKQLEPDHIKIRAALLKGPVEVCALSCSLKKETIEGSDESARFIINEWTINPTT